MSINTVPQVKRSELHSSRWYVVGYRDYGSFSTKRKAEAFAQKVASK